MNFKQIASVILALTFPTTLHASSAGPGKVSNPWAEYNGTFMFDGSAAKSALPPCPGITAVPNRWAIDSKTPAGQAMISVVMTAYALNKNVIVIGTNNCSVWSDTETVWFVYIYD